jgi:hypothetical protein
VNVNADDEEEEEEAGTGGETSTTGGGKRAPDEAEGGSVALVIETGVGPIAGDSEGVLLLVLVRLDEAQTRQESTHENCTNK